MKMHMYVSPIVNMSRSNAIKSSIPMNYLFVSFLHPLRQQTPILVVLVLKKKKKKVLLISHVSFDRSEDPVIHDHVL